MKGVSPENLLVAETFRSIQGESTYTGLPCFFVRLAGCNLACRYCDTQYARKIQASGHGQRTVESIISSKNPNDKLVCITGGEPLLQEGSLILMDRLVKRGCTVLLETNGSLDISSVPKDVIRIMDIKCPGSGMEHQNHYENLKYLTNRDQLKFVISSREDFEFTSCIVDKHKLDPAKTPGPTGHTQTDDSPDNSSSRHSGPHNSPNNDPHNGPHNSPHIILSPASPFCSPRELAKWLLESGRNWRLQVQLHKIIWPEHERGV